MTFRSVKELQQQQRPTSGAAAAARPAVEASSRAQDASGELAMKMSKLRALSDADKDLITTLQQRIDEQKSELESRTAMVEAVQRNFENLSNMAVREREELARLRADLEAGKSSGGAAATDGEFTAFDSTQPAVLPSNVPALPVDYEETEAVVDLRKLLLQQQTDPKWKQRVGFFGAHKLTINSQ